MTGRVPFWRCDMNDPAGGPADASDHEAKTVALVFFACLSGAT